jgi:hypothetical protein
MSARKPNPEREASFNYLCDVCPPGTTVYTMLVSVSRSGMSRTMRVFVVHDSIIVNITHHVARVIDYRMRDGAMVVKGCGMDMGYHVVHSLSYALHGMVNKPVGAIAPHPGTCETAPEAGYRAGYTLRQEWL